MIDMQREVTTDASPEAVFAYLSDFSNSQQWDPGSLRTVRVEGDGGVGTRYANTSEFAGRTSNIDYEVIEFHPGTSLTLRGTNSSLVALDTITVAPKGTGSTVTYRVQFAFQGWLRWAEPVLRIFMKKLLDDGEKGMQRELNRLVGH
ncbi:MAG: polyketide cyclase [Rhodococcus sp.]|nr:polyketide cyclase [Rhodococcus sp. (in: high G+C Gram-positive bacteria)]